MLLKDTLKAVLGCFKAGAGINVDSQQVATGVVHDGQGVAPLAVGGLELAFVVHAPQAIGLAAGAQWLLGGVDAPASALALDEAFGFEDVVDGGFAGRVPCAPALLEHGHQLLGAWLTGCGGAQLDDGLTLGVADGKAVVQGLAALLLQTICAQLAVTGNPLVARLATDAVALAQLAERARCAQVVGDEQEFLIHWYAFLPWHRGLLGCCLKTVSKTSSCYLCP